MNKDKSKGKNSEEEKKLGEISLQKLLEVYSYNIVVDQFFMKTTKKIVEIDKVLRSLKNKTGSAFVSKFLFENKEKFSKSYKYPTISNSISTTIIDNLIEKKIINKKRKAKSIGQGQEKFLLKGVDKKDKNFLEKENVNIKNDLLDSKVTKRRKVEFGQTERKLNEKYIYAHLLINSYSNVSPLEYQPNKSINERVDSMRKKILNYFPEVDNNKIERIEEIK